MTVPLYLARRDSVDIPANASQPLACPWNGGATWPNFISTGSADTAGKAQSPSARARQIDSARCLFILDLPRWYGNRFACMRPHVYHASGSCIHSSDPVSTEEMLN